MKFFELAEGLEIDLNLYREEFKDMSPEALINKAVFMTSFEEPDWAIFAGRLLVKETERKVEKNRGFGYGNFLKTIDGLTEKNIYDRALIQYDMEEIKELGAYIKPERDLLYDYAGANMLVNRYLLKYEGMTYELPQEVFMAISMLLSLKENNRVEIAKQIYDKLSLKKISLATPLLANLRVPNGNLSSCFITAMDDNIESIFYNVEAIAKISKNGGGAGLNLSRIRAKGSWVNGYPNASGGVVPWIKIVNDTAVAVNQQGRRAGAVTVALDTWHLDIENFIELQTENGDQRGKAYDIYPQVVASDLFMKRVEADEMWTLVDPYEIKKVYGVELCELYGNAFEEIYLKLEKDENVKIKKSISARELFKHIMKTQIETGMPYIFFKDTANRNNHNSHRGMIGNGNLCMESFSNFSPTTNLKDIPKIGEVHTCNLVSLNLAEIDDEELQEVTGLAVRILDNTIDLTTTPLKESDNHNNLYRTIGIGAMGLADYLAENFMIYDESQEEIEGIFERISAYALKESALIAKEKGSYEYFKGSKWDEGIFFGKDREWYGTVSKYPELWNEVFTLVKEYGLRNGEVTAVAPNTSTSLLMGSTASVNPAFSRFFIEKNQKGAVPRVVKHLKDRAWFYPEFKNVDPKTYVKIMAGIGRWVSQGVSMELIFDLNKDIRAKDIYETLMTAWKEGCKSIYYIRTIQKNTNVAREKEECESCSG